jgi:hypothetical protein
MNNLLRHRARLFCVVVLSGFLAACGGGGDGDAPVVASPLEGVWTGKLTDAAGNVYTIESEHIASGASIKGATRIVAEDGTIHHGALTGTETAAGMDWSADFRGTLGVVDFRGTRNGKSMTLAYTQRGTTPGSGTGTLTLAKTGTVDLRGTYQVDWIANGQSGNFQFTVVSPGFVNTIPQVDILVFDSYMGFFGSCVGATISVGTSVFTGAASGAYTLVKMHFSAVEAGASGTITGTTSSGGASTPIKGTYKLTKISG